MDLPVSPTQDIGRGDSCVKLVNPGMLRMHDRMVHSFTPSGCEVPVGKIAGVRKWNPVDES